MRAPLQRALMLIALGTALGTAWADPPHQGGRDLHGEVRGPRGRPPEVIVRVPPRAPTVVWEQVPYRYDRGVWYRPQGHGHVVVRPPYGVVIRERPYWATAVLVGGLTYLVANGVYYREQPERGWEVVPPPATMPGAAAEGPGRLFIYPRHGQTAQQQRDDEFECHRWAAAQTGFDPTQAATGTLAPAEPRGRADYDRAFGACLDGRGYTVR